MKVGGVTLIKDTISQSQTTNIVKKLVNLFYVSKIGYFINYLLFSVIWVKGYGLMSIEIKMM